MQLTGAGRPQCLEQRNLSGRPRLDRIDSLCKLVLSKMPMIASTSRRQIDVRVLLTARKDQQLASSATETGLAPESLQTARRKMSDTSGFQRRDLELRFRDSQEMSGPHVCTPLHSKGTKSYVPGSVRSSDATPATFSQTLQISCTSSMVHSIDQRGSTL